MGQKRFIPSQQAAKLAKAAQMHGVLSAAGVDPAHYKLTAAEVAALGTLLAQTQAAYAARENIKAAKKAITHAFSGPGQLLDQLTVMMQDFGGKIRVSDCTDDEALKTGTNRRKAGLTPQTAPANPPGVTLDSLQPGLIRLRIYDIGSAGVRARAQNACGAQIAVVNGTAAITANEADTVPTILAPRSPWPLDSTKMPDTVRIYARWQTPRGLNSPWSAPLTVHVA